MDGGRGTESLEPARRFRTALPLDHDLRPRQDQSVASWIVCAVELAALDVPEPVATSGRATREDEGRHPGQAAPNDEPAPLLEGHSVSMGQGGCGRATVMPHSGLTSRSSGPPSRDAPRFLADLRLSPGFRYPIPLQIRLILVLSPPRAPCPACRGGPRAKSARPAPAAGSRTRAS